MGIGQALHKGDGRALLVRVRVAGELDGEQGAPCSGIPGVVDCLSAILDERALNLGPEIVVPLEEALAATRDLCRRGFPVGVSSGLNLCGARRLASRLGPGHHVATVFCDRMERYFSTDLFADLRTSESE
jgi:cysteine synthase A